MYPMVQTNQSRQPNQQQQEQPRKGNSNGGRAVGDGGTNVQPGCAGPHQGPSLAGAGGGGTSKASAKLQQKRRESRAVIVSRRQSTMQQEDVESQHQETTTKHRKPSSIYRRLYNYVRQAWTGVKSALGITKSGLDNELEELEITPRYRPDSLEALRRATRFTEAELKTIYRGFKAECPTGIVREDTFKFIYSQFFPQANTNNYAHYVFNTLDQDRSGLVSFEEFVLGLSVLSRGSLDEKLRWTFSLYDINGDGYITREEMTDIVTAIYDLMGKLVEPSVDDDAVKEKVDRIFQKMDVNRDGVVTLDEFLECCRKDEDISSSMAVFDTSI